MSIGRVQSIGNVLHEAARRDPFAIAILGPGRTPVTYRSLCGALDGVRAALNRAGFGRGDRVALVVPDGPEMAVAALAVASCCVCVPLNPSYKANEYDDYLTDLKLSALVIEAHLDTPARRAAQLGGIPVIDLVPIQDAGAGLFTLTSRREGFVRKAGMAEPHETAFVMQSSGTTGRSKRIPVSHVNLWFRYSSRLTSLRLTASDRVLNLMRLYHGSGLQTLLAALAAGGSAVCPPGPDVDGFFAWLAEYRPTWYAAPPPTHRAIVARAATNRGTIADCSLRFIRSSSGALSSQLQKDVEAVFGVPVLPAYGMTESGVVCSSPLPPGRAKPGSVGVPVGPELAIMDDAGAMVPTGSVGEVVIRGPAVFDGYEDDPQATAAAFRDGWFRTGDLGILDADGYVFLKGRIKDVINHGGQKVSPREVEDRLAEHPDVGEAVVFPLPHPTLGEDVAAAVVLRSGMTTAEDALRQFVAVGLANFKVPCRVLTVDDIPKSPNGKVNRQALADHFRGLLATPSATPEDPYEKTLAGIWAEELEVDRVGVRDNFFELGGDSLRVTRMCARVQAATGRALSVATVYNSPTVAQLAAVLRRGGDANRSSSFLVPIQAEGSRPPLFCMHSRWGYSDDYTPLALRLGPDQPVYGLQARGFDGAEPSHTSIGEMAVQYVQEIRALFPSGPYLLCGYSSAGVLAWEMAQLLRAQGQQVALLALLDANLHLDPALVPERVAALQVYRRRTQRHLDVLRTLPPREGLAYVLNRLAARRRRDESAGHPRPAPDPWHRPTQLRSLQAFLQTHGAARRAYRPRAYPGPITLFLARQPRDDVDLRRDPRLPGRLAAGPVEIHEVSGNHATFLQEPRARGLAKILRKCIDRAIGSAANLDPYRGSSPEPMTSNDRAGQTAPSP